MKDILARVSGLATVVLVLFVLGSALVARPGQAQSEQVSDQDKAVHYSLYYEDFKNQNFQSALPNLRWIIQKAPGYPRDDDRNYERLIETYVGLAEQAEGDARSAYLDSALVVFDEAVPALKEVGAEVDELQWTLRKGRFIQEHAADMADHTAEVPEIYAKAFEMASCELDPYYVRVIIDSEVRAGNEAEALELMDQAESCYAENEETMTYITEVRNNLFDSPEERLTFLESRLEKDPENVEVASELFQIYLNVGQRDKAAELGTRLAEMTKTARTYRMLGQLHLQDGEAEKAFEYYEEALTLPDADEVRRDIVYNMGIAQQEMGNHSRARTYFRQAIDEDPNFGQAYMAIGDLYVTAVSNCGSFEREDRAVYWLAVDYYEKAKSADPNITSQANQKISTYRRSFPDQEALFFKGWQPGQSYSVNYGCYSWIGETTRVRQP